MKNHSFVTIEETNRFVLTRFITPNFPLRLKKPLEMTVYFEDQKYIVENDLFEIFSFHSDFRKAMIEFENQIADLWEIFVRGEEADFKGNVFKNLLRTYVREKNVEL